ncbi:MAG: hypothetical protein VB130_08525, partial [Clostridium sp.]|nr:hypothetical protein [Clostridium sp.]
AREGYDPVYGARPLKRYISKTLETSIAKMIIKGEVYDGSTVVISSLDEKLNIRVK